MEFIITVITQLLSIRQEIDFQWSLPLNQLKPTHSNLMTSAFYSNIVSKNSYNCLWILWNHKKTHQKHENCFPLLILTAKIIFTKCKMVVFCDYYRQRVCNTVATFLLCLYAGFSFWTSLVWNLSLIQFNSRTTTLDSKKKKRKAAKPIFFKIYSANSDRSSKHF